MSEEAKKEEGTAEAATTTRRRRRKTAEAKPAAEKTAKPRKSRAKKSDGSGEAKPKGKSKKTGAPTGEKGRPAKKPTETVGGLTRSLLAKNWSDDKILAKVQESFPDSKFNKAHLSCYRSRMKKAGDLPA